MDILDDAAALPEQPGHDALRALASQLDALVGTLDATDLDAVRSGDPRRILARHPDGPVLALRWYEPNYVSTVHSHAWTILRCLEGVGTLERFDLVGDKAQVRAVEPTDAPSLCVLDGGEIHRQQAGGDGVLEFVLIGDYDPTSPHTEYAT